MPRLLGAHMSIAGGYYKAVEAAAALGMSTCQIFTKNNTQWRAKAITCDEAEAFRAALARLGIVHPIAHDSYLINLASPDRALWKRSIDAFVIELRRAELLGLAAVVTHPGSYTTSTPTRGLARVIRAFNEIHAQTGGIQVSTLLETTAGQGTALGWQFEQLATILAGVKDPDRLGVCLDTCHLFAAGYPLVGRGEYLSTMRALDSIVGIEQVRAIHVNDSKRECGSRVDRHEHIGAGRLGLEPFRHFLNDPRFRRTPMYLETPKGQINGEEWDRVNLDRLRSLLKGRRAEEEGRRAEVGF